MITALRTQEFREIAGLQIEKIDDYQEGKGEDLMKGMTYHLTLPNANVIRYSFSGGGIVMVRPSGTEPKIKFYFSVKNETKRKLHSNIESREAMLS